MTNRGKLVYKSINEESKSVNIQEADKWKLKILPSLMPGYTKSVWPIL